LHFIFLHNPPRSIHVSYRLQSASIPLGKKVFFVDCATSYAPLVIPLHRIGSSFLLVILLGVQICDSCLGWGPVSKVPRVHTQNEDFEWSLSLRGPYEAARCHAVKGHLLKAVCVACCV